MTRLSLAGACASAAILLATIGANAQTTAPAPQPAPASDQPAADQGVTDQGSGSDQAGSDEEKQAPIPFEGGQLTITQPEQDGEKVLSYDGKQLASNYDVFFDRIVKIGDVNVALVDVGDGGNQCGPAKVIVWKPKDGEIQTTTVEQDECGAPPAAISDSAVYFVPYLLPGDSKPALCNGRPRKG